MATPKAPKTTIKTRILIMSDTHDGYQRWRGRQEPWSLEGSFRPPLPKADILIHSGDLTMTGTMEQYRGVMAMLASVDAELKLVIAGNHDLSLHKDYYLNNPKARSLASAAYDPAAAQQAEDFWTGEEAQKSGVTYLEEGMHTFTTSKGAAFSVYASPWQPAFFDWAFNYPHNEDRWNPPHLVKQCKPVIENTIPAPPERDPHPIPEGAEVDIVITHGPPRKHLDATNSGHFAGCPHLLNALDRVRPRLHCFGHIHEAWGAEIVKWKTSSRKKAGEQCEEEGEILGCVASPTSKSGDAQTPDDSQVMEKRGSYIFKWKTSSRKNKHEQSEAEGEIRGSEASSSSKGVDVQRPDDQDVIDRRANYVDVSASGPRPLIHGEETLLVNSCIMDLRYEANYSAWLVDLELPIKE